MPWDLAISEHGDLIVSGHGDLLGKSGIQLIEQRMILRLRLHRGSWIFDETKTLGSNLHRLIGLSASDAAASAPAYVREALRPMTEIQVNEVNVLTEDDRSILIVIFYQLLPVSVGFVDTGEERELQVAFSLAATSSGAGE